MYLSPDFTEAEPEQRLLELAADDLESEAAFLSGVVELAQVRVREAMTPRVDMLLLDVREERREPVVQFAGRLFVADTDGHADEG